MSPESAGPRDRIVAAAVECIAVSGWERTTFSEVARAAGVSRPTLYAYFATREDLLTAATEHAAVQIAEQLVRKAKRATTAGEFVVELMVSGVRAYQNDTAANLIALVLPGASPLGDEPVIIARRILLPLLDYRPDLEPELDEIAETMIRFLLSFMVYESSRSRSPRALRAYLRRRLLPALGLDEALQVTG